MGLIISSRQLKNVLEKYIKKSHSEKNGFLILKYIKAFKGLGKIKN